MLLRWHIPSITVYTPKLACAAKKKRMITHDIDSPNYANAGAPSSVQFRHGVAVAAWCNRWDLPAIKYPRPAMERSNAKKNILIGDEFWIRAGTPSTVWKLRWRRSRKIISRVAVPLCRRMLHSVGIFILFAQRYPTAQAAGTGCKRFEADVDAHYQDLQLGGSVD